MRIRQKDVEGKGAGCVNRPFQLVTNPQWRQLQFQLSLTGPAIQIRSAFERVIDQYRVSTVRRSGIVNDPNREDDSEYIVRLVGQVITVSPETVRLVKELDRLPLSE